MTVFNLWIKVVDAGLLLLLDVTVQIPVLSVLCYLQIAELLEPMCCAGVVLIGAWSDTFLSIEVLLPIHVFYKQFLVYTTPGHQALRISYKCCFNTNLGALTNREEMFSIEVNIAKGTTDPGVNCFDQ